MITAADPGRPPGDRGSATVWATVVAGALCVVFAAVLAMAQAVAARHRAGGAADLAALAAADRALHGLAAACAAAAHVAEAQRTELVRCAVHGEIAEVTARARFGPYAADVRARAGPAVPDALAAPGTAAPDAQGAWRRTRGQAKPPTAGTVSSPRVSRRTGAARYRRPGLAGAARHRIPRPAGAARYRIPRPAGAATHRASLIQGG